jgi:hypothetical protein
MTRQSQLRCELQPWHRRAAIRRPIARCKAYAASRSNSGVLYAG